MISRILSTTHRIDSDLGEYLSRGMKDSKFIEHIVVPVISLYFDVPYAYEACGRFREAIEGPEVQMEKFRGLWCGFEPSHKLQMHHQNTIDKYRGAFRALELVTERVEAYYHVSGPHMSFNIFGPEYFHLEHNDAWLRFLPTQPKLASPFD